MVELIMSERKTHNSFDCMGIKNLEFYLYETTVQNYLIIRRFHGKINRK